MERVGLLEGWELELLFLQQQAFIEHSLFSRAPEGFSKVREGRGCCSWVSSGPLGVGGVSEQGEGLLPRSRERWGDWAGAWGCV